MAASHSQLSGSPDNLFLLPLPTFLPLRYHPGGLKNWSGHLAFANDLLSQLKPSVLVELGTHFGESYFGMCQSVVENGIDCVCYAVDHWRGEEHAGEYGEEVFAEVDQYNKRFYQNFSYLLRTSFDNALNQFSDQTIDLLHIDGLHTYEAGRHDFESWFSKVRPGGIILLHDVMVRHADFGIWKLWEELSEEFAECFTFHHGWGLGVLRKPGGSSEVSQLEHLLFSAGGETSERIRRHYVLYACYLESTAKVEPAGNLISRPVVPVAPSGAPGPGSDFAKVQIYPFNADGYSEIRSAFAVASIGGWSSLTLNLEAGSLEGPLRFDPSDTPCLVELRDFEILDIETDRTLLKLATPSDFAQLEAIDSAIYLPDRDKCLLFCYGRDPKLQLKHKLQFPGPIRICVTLQIQVEMEPVAASVRTAGEAEPEHHRTKLLADIETLQGEIQASQSSRSLLAAELSVHLNEKKLLLSQLEEEKQRLSEKFIADRNSLLRANEEAVSMEQARSERLDELLEDQRNIAVEALASVREKADMLNSVLGSMSWRITRPVRYILESIRGVRKKGKA